MNDSEDTRFSGLLDAERRHLADPDSFSIPRSDVRSSLQPGDLVKLLFGFGGGDQPPAERMWVEVLEVQDAGYLGRLENQPQAISDLSPGARVSFEPRHVAATYSTTPHAPRPEQSAIVSHRIWRDGDRPTRAVRMPAPDDAFSGWVVFGPSDPPLPPDDLAGFGPVSHQALTDRWRALDSIEDEPPMTRWRWDPSEFEWRRDTDDGPTT